MTAGDLHSCDEQASGPQRLNHWARVDLRLPGTVFWVVPMWAAVCGAAASGPGLESLVRLWPAVLLLVLVAGPVLSTINALALGAMSVNLAQARGAEKVASVKVGNLLPYAVPRSLAGTAASRLCATASRWAESVRTTRGQCAVGLVALSAFVLLLLGILGDTLLLAVACHLAWLMVGVFLLPNVMVRHPWFLTGSQMMVAWLVGYCLLEDLNWAILALSAIMGAVSWATLSCEGNRYSRRVTLSYLFQGAAAGILLSARLPIAAGALMLLVGAQFLLRSEGQQGTGYAMRVQVILMMVMLIVSIGLATHQTADLPSPGAESARDERISCPPMVMSSLLWQRSECLRSACRAEYGHAIMGV